jgi:hypothetical protein
MATDRMVVTILKDGTIRSVVDPISGANHSNAEGFFEILKQKTGGTETRESRGEHGHDHSHSQDHQHQ